MYARHTSRSPRLPIRVRPPRHVGAADEKLWRGLDLAARRQRALVAQIAREREQLARLVVEHGLRVGLIAAFRVVALQDQQVLDSLRGRADQVARKRDAVAIAAGHLQDRLVAVGRENRRSREAAHRRLARGGVRDVDRIDLTLQKLRLRQ
jgi:hypothetical protein